jgi:hypothetical protein
MLDRAAVFSALGVVSDHLTDRLRSFPRDIALVRSGSQCQPVFARLAPTPLPRSGAVVDCGRAGLTVGIGAAIGRVGKNPIDRSITMPFPNDVAMRSSGRQSQPVFQEPQQRLSNGGEFGEFWRRSARSLPERDDPGPSRALALQSSRNRPLVDVDNPTEPWVLGIKHLQNFGHMGLAAPPSTIRCGRTAHCVTAHRRSSRRNGERPRCPVRNQFRPARESPQRAIHWRYSPESVESKKRRPDRP